jgi:DNA polymerase III alpha subunit (gram-positive type)
MFFENLFAAKGLTKIWVEKIELKEKKNTAAFYLFSREIIDFKAIDDIEDEIKNRYENAVNIEIHIRYELKEWKEEELVEKIKGNIYYVIGKGSNILSKAKDKIKLEFKDDSFNIIINNRLLIREFTDKDIERKLLKLMGDYNLNYKIRTTCQEEKEGGDLEAERIFEEELQKNLEIIKNNTSSKKSSADSQKAYGRTRKKYNFDDMPLSSISELTSDSGLVKIKGRIISAEKINSRFP